MTNETTNVGEGGRVSNDGSGSDSPATPGDYADSPGPAYVDVNQFSGGEPEVVKDAESLLKDIGETIESPSAAKEDLIRAHEKLCKVFTSGHSGVDAAHLEHRLSRIEALIETLDTVVDLLTETESLDSEEDTAEIATRYRTAIQSAAVYDITLPTVSAALEDLPTSPKPDTQGEDDDGVPTDDDGSGESGESDSGSDLRRQLIEDIETVDSDLHRLPRYDDMHENGQFKAEAYSEEFGSWGAAVDASAVDVEGRLIESLVQVAEQVGRAPTKSEIEEHGAYDIGWYESYFNSWTAARKAAGVALPDDEVLLAELEDLQDELGFVPANHHVEEHGKYPPQFYRRRFDSVKQATVEAGMDYRQDVIEQVRSVARSVGRRPKTTDFDDEAVYSSSYIYDLFDGWGEACKVAGVASDEDVQALSLDDEAETGPEAGHDEGSKADSKIQSSALAEYYELFRNLTLVQAQLFDASIQDQLGDESPMARWHAEIRDRWGGKPTDDPEGGYGQQITDQSDFELDEYRIDHGDGGVIMEFSAIEAASLPASIAELLSLRSDIPTEDAQSLRVPQAPHSERTLPIIVESDEEYDRAVALLRECPAEPPVSDNRDSEDDEPTPEDSATTATGEINNGDESLTDINGITESVAETLRNAGYETKAALKEAETDEIADIDGVGSQLANRIKLIIGG